MFTQAYSPEQSAHGQLENGRHILILYVKELARELYQINQQGIHKYEYSWFNTEDLSEHVLHITWENDVHVSVRFTQAHQNLLDYLLEPRDVILTGIPIPELVDSSNNGEFINLTGPVATFSGLMFMKPEEITQQN